MANKIQTYYNIIKTSNLEILGALFPNKEKMNYPEELALLLLRISDPLTPRKKLKKSNGLILKNLCNGWTNK